MSLIEDATRELWGSSTGQGRTIKILTDMINEIERRQREHVRKTYNATSFYDRNTIEAVSAEVFQQLRGEE